MAHGEAREGKWRGNWRMEWVASTLTLPRNWCIQHYLRRGLLVASSRSHFSEKACVSVASRAVWGQSTSCVPWSLCR